MAVKIDIEINTKDAQKQTEDLKIETQELKNAILEQTNANKEATRVRKEQEDSIKQAETNTKELTEQVKLLSDAVLENIKADKDQEIAIKQSADAHAFAIGKVMIAYDLFKAGVSIAIDAIRGLVSTFTSAINEASQFEKALTDIKTIAPTTDMQALSKSLLDVSSSWGIDKITAANAQYDIMSSGITDAGEAFKVFEGAAKLAVATGAQTSETAKTITAAINAWGMSANDVGQVMDSLAITTQDGVVRMSELGPVFGQVAATAASAGVTLQELNSGIAALTLGGTPASQAGTQLKAVIAGLLKPSEDLAAAFQKQAGQSTASYLASNGLAKTLEVLKAITKGNAEETSRLFGSQEAVAGLLPLITTQSDNFTKSLNKQNAAIKDGGKVTQEMADIVSQGADFQMKKMRESISNVSTEIASFFLPAIAKAAQSLSSIVENIRTFVRENQDGFKSAANAASEFATTIVRDVINGIKSFIDTIKTTSAFLSEHKDLILGVSVALGTFAIAFGTATLAVQAFGAISAAGGLAAILTSITTAIGGLSGVMALATTASASFLGIMVASVNPITLVAVGIAAVAGSIVYLNGVLGDGNAAYSEWKSITISIEEAYWRLGKSILNGLKSILEMAAAIPGLNSAMQSMIGIIDKKIASREKELLKDRQLLQASLQIQVDKQNEAKAEKSLVEVRKQTSEEIKKNIQNTQNLSKENNALGISIKSLADIINKGAEGNAKNVATKNTLTKEEIKLAEERQKKEQQMIDDGYIKTLTGWYKEFYDVVALGSRQVEKLADVSGKVQAPQNVVTAGPLQVILTNEQRASDEMQKNLKDIQKTAGGVISSLKTASQAFKNVKGDSDPQAQLEAASTVAMAASDVLSKIPGPVGMIGSTIAGLAALVFQLPQILKDLPGMLIGFIKAIPTLVVELSKAIPIFVNTIIENLPFIIGDLIAAIPAMLAGIFEAMIKLAFPGKIGSLIWDGVKAAFEKTGAWLANVGRTIWDGLKSAFTQFGSWLANVGKAIWTGLGNAVSAGFSTLASWGSAIWNGLKEAASSAFEFVARIGKQIWDGLWTAIDKAWDAFKQIGKRIWEGLVEGLETIGDFFSGGTDGGAVWYDPTTWFDLTNAVDENTQAIIDSGSSSSQPYFIPPGAQNLAGAIMAPGYQVESSQSGYVVTEEDRRIEAAYSELANAIEALKSQVNLWGQETVDRDVAKLTATLRSQGLNEWAANHGLMQYSSGGIIPGDSPKNDIIPAMLSPGEMVIPRSAMAGGLAGILSFAKQTLGNSRTINMANGGIVSSQNAILSSANIESRLISLEMVMREVGYAVAKTSLKTLNLLDEWNSTGLPETRTI